VISLPFNALMLLVADIWLVEIPLRTIPKKCPLGNPAKDGLNWIVEQNSEELGFEFVSASMHWTMKSLCI